MLLTVQTVNPSPGPLSKLLFVKIDVTNVALKSTIKS